MELTRFPSPPMPLAPISNNAERSTWHLGDPDPSDRIWRNRIFNRYPNPLANVMSGIYKNIWNKEGRREANLWLLGENEGANKELVNLALSEDAISYIAELKAKKCQRISQAFKEPKPLYEVLESETSKFGIKAPEVKKHVTYVSAINRMTAKQWWRRQIRKMSAREFESLAIRYGLVHRRKSIYLSDSIFKRIQDQHRLNFEMLSRLEAVNELGDALGLADLVEHSLANPVNRRAELMTRIEGFDHLALEYGHESYFLTVTCPSKYHARMSSSGDENPNYRGYTPKEAQSYLAQNWAMVRAKLKRQSIQVYGFRIAEPHHDGTPHWHLLLFVEPSQAESLIHICREYALMEDQNELGADKHRFKVEHIDRSKGSAVAYVAKYISKSIDGFGVDVDHYGKDAKSSALRVVAWAKMWGIRQFQQIGGPPVGIWRELRRLSERPAGIIGKAFDPADQGDWAGFVQAMGGPFCTRADQAIRLAKLSATDVLTGEIRLNQYMEPASDQVYGVEAGGVSICTRVHEWRIQTKPIGLDLGLSEPIGLNTGLEFGSGEPIDQVNLGVLIYRSDTDQNLIETAIFENLRGIDRSTLEFCQ